NDPLDICVITERNIPHGNLILDAIPLGGLRMIDGEEADDKIIAVLSGDATFGHMRDISEVPEHMVERLSHYFLTTNNALLIMGNGSARSLIFITMKRPLKLLTGAGKITTPALIQIKRNCLN